MYQWVIEDLKHPQNAIFTPFQCSEFSIQPDVQPHETLNKQVLSILSYRMVNNGVNTCPKHSPFRLRGEP